MSLEEIDGKPSQDIYTREVAKKHPNIDIRSEYPQLVKEDRESKTVKVSTSENHRKKEIDNKSVEPESIDDSSEFEDPYTALKRWATVVILWGFLTPIFRFFGGTETGILGTVFTIIGYVGILFILLGILSLVVILVDMAGE